MSSAYLGFSIYFLSIVSCNLQTATVLLLRFQFGFLLFIYFSCLIVIAMTFNAMLNKSGKSGHLGFLSASGPKVSDCMALEVLELVF